MHVWKCGAWLSSYEKTLWGRVNFVMVAYQFQDEIHKVCCLHLLGDNSHGKLKEAYNFNLWVYMSGIMVVIGSHERLGRIVNFIMGHASCKMKMYKFPTTSTHSHPII